MPSDVFMTAVEVAAELGVSKSTAYKLMREMGRVRVGRVVRVKRDAFDAWVASHTEPRPPRAPRKKGAEGQLTLGFVAGRSPSEGATRPR
jgi:excisionase family DNA binding protein